MLNSILIVRTSLHVVFSSLLNTDNVFFLAMCAVVKLSGTAAHNTPLSLGEKYGGASECNVPWLSTEGNDCNGYGFFSETEDFYFSKRWHLGASYLL